MKKKCNTHGLTDYALRADGRFRCKKCATEAVQRRRENVKKMAIEYKGGKCEKCGYNKCVGALEFHHKVPSKKDFGISHKGYTRAWETIKKELDKCVMVCANCHREIHEKENLNSDVA